MASRLLFLLFSFWLFGASSASAQSGVPEGPRIGSLEFRDTTISEAIRLVSDLTNANILATAAASERSVTMILKNTTLRGAVASIARVSGLAFTYDADTRAFLILTPQEFANEVVITGDGETRIFTLRNQNVAVAAQVIESLFGDRVSLTLDTSDPDALIADIDNLTDEGDSNTGATSNRVVSFSRSIDSGERAESLGDLRDELSGRASARDRVNVITGERENFSDLVTEFGLEPPIFVTVNRDHNLLYVRTVDTEAMQSIEQIVKATDRPTMQVLLEMKILSLSLDDDFNAIFNFGLNETTTTTNTGVLGDTTGVTGASGGASGLLGGALFFQFLSDNLLAQIEFLERNNRAETVSTPLLVASNNSPAELFVGDEVVLTRGFTSDTVVGSTGSTSTQTTTETEIREVGQTLQIQPRINADRTVTLALQQENSVVIENGGQIPTVDSDGDISIVDIDTVNTARLSGTVTARDGNTIAVGGLFRRDESRATSQIPLFGDVPFVGRLGSADVDERDRRELVLLITPHVYSTGIEGERIARERLSALSASGDIDRNAFEASDKLTPDAKTPNQEQSYISLTRFAAARAKGFYVQRAGQYSDIQDSPIAAASPKVFGTSGVVTAEPAFAFRKKGLYVTALLLENVSDTVATLDPTQLRNRWLAATLETDILAPRGQAGSRDFIYLLSNRPYDEVIGNGAVGGAL
ncbi:MAG: DUF3438 family protein [Pseudomonadota bacterium]